MSDSQVNKFEQGIGKYFFRSSSKDFQKISGSPIAYWIGEKFRAAFQASELGSISISKQGLATGDNERFLRFWHETSFNSINWSSLNLNDSKLMAGEWVPYSKGGSYRKWYGNGEYIVRWVDGGEEIRQFKDENGKEKSRFRAADFYFLPAVTWSLTSSSAFGCRYRPAGSVFDINGMSLFPNNIEDSSKILALLNSKVADHILGILNPTMAFQIGDISSIPTIFPDEHNLAKNEKVSRFPPVVLSRNDWDACETSWDFTSLQLLSPDYRQSTIKASYQMLRAHWREMTLEMQRLEQENNRIFIDAYGLKDELDAKVDLSEITLTCNPHYRYGGDKSEEELEALLLADTMRDLVSYAVGCMFGRYSLDKPGLILANQGETLADYLAQVPEPSFPADDDNVIPLLDGDWFPDDITLRFRQFLRVAFGDAHYEDNLAFIEQALNVKGKRNYSLRDYFLSEFYADHVKRYKKRPIYWLFSSPKGTFSALVYLHRYRPDTVSVVLNYLRDFRKKLASRLDYLQQVAINPSASQSEKTKASKEADTIKKQLIELDDYERDTLYPLATEQVELDLDDGVKVNYLKLGAALKKIVGLDAKGED
ncbi:BREX-1 system adenine-specific DNA-methyltransferase PglX [Stutzerimonas stutzeri]|uniref:BREX-1 system adenine-specific DNA-methyltransferase PglX n=1 Tax=Stutzerimonas stutzeri TaxID=316 RepID=UPI00371CF768